MSTLPSARVKTALPALSLDTLLGPWVGSADPAYCRDLEGRLLAVNPAFARKFGRASPEWAGTSLIEILHPDRLRQVGFQGGENVFARQLLEGRACCVEVPVLVLHVRARPLRAAPRRERRQFFINRGMIDTGPGRQQIV